MLLNKFLEKKLFKYLYFTIFKHIHAFKLEFYSFKQIPITHKTEEFN